MLIIHILTVAPEMFDSFWKNHVVDRALHLGVLALNVTDIREYAEGCFRKVDDSPMAEALVWFCGFSR